MFVFKLGLSRLYSQQRWMAKTEVVLSHCIWLASTNVVSMYEKELVLQVGSLAWTLLSENKKNIHELFEASFEESSLADYTLDEGC